MTKKFIPPKLIDNKVEFTNKYMTLNTDTIVLTKPDGIQLKSEYYYVDCPNFVVGIAIKNNQILMVNQYRYPVGRFDLEFVAGMVDHNKNPEESMLAEFKEEAGIVADSVTLIGEYCPLPGQNSNKGFVYYTYDFSEAETSLEEYEQCTDLTKVWIPLNAFSQMIYENKIKDGVTLAAWAMFQESFLIKNP
jgi:8-oxo-dGTP pyrophosphatase MutT (NUDIX family)